MTPPASGSGDWTYRVLQQFDVSNGAIPYAVIRTGKTVYGVTPAGGQSQANCTNVAPGLGCGTVFQVEF